MGWTIEIEDGDYARLRQHLDGDVEQVAFLFAEPHAGDQCLRVRDLQLIKTEEFNYQTGYHVELAEEVRPALIKRAWDENACLVEAHSHLHGPARFSPSDLAGFEDWVPHLRWRLQGRPYAALVFAPNDFDALIWDGDGLPGSIEALEISGGRRARLAPTNHTLGTPSVGVKDKKPWWRRIIGR